MPKTQRERELKPSANVPYLSPHTKRMTSPYPLQRGRNLQLSIPGHSSAPSSPVSVLGLEGPCSSVSKATDFSRRQDSWLTALQTSSDLEASSPWPSACPNVNARLRPSYVTSCSSYGALVSAVFVSSPVSLTLLQLPSLISERVPGDTQASQMGIHPSGYVTTHCTFSRSHTQFGLSSSLRSFRKAQLLICLYCTMCLKLLYLPLYLTPPHSCLKMNCRGVLLLSGDPCSAPL